MKKKTKKLIWLVLFFIVLLAGYFALDYLPEKTEEDVAETVAETIAVTTFSEEDIVSYRYSNADHEMELAVTEDGYVNTADALFEVNGDKAAAQISAIANLTALQKIDNTDKSEYGLDAPEITITVTLSDGTERNLYIGDSALFEAADYLLDVENDSIYLIDETLYSAFNCTLEEMEVQEEVEATEETEVTDEAQETEEITE